MIGIGAKASFCLTIPANSGPVHPGHIHVHEDDVRLGLDEEGNHLLGIRRAHGHHPRAREDRGIVFHLLGIVVHDEDAEGLGVPLVEEGVDLLRESDRIDRKLEEGLAPARTVLSLDSKSSLSA